MYVHEEGKYLLGGRGCLASRLDLLLRWRKDGSFLGAELWCQVTYQPSGNDGCRALFTAAKSELWTVSVHSTHLVTSQLSPTA